jgi:fimbrial chaperone protein
MRGRALSMLGLLAAAAPAVASTFSISPLRLELSAASSTAILTVRNQDDSPVVVQVRPQAWSQSSDRDQLDDTHDLLVSPPLFTLAPKAEQIVRIALLRKPDATRELDYRVVLAEVPPAAPLDFTGLRVALRITLPAFVAAQTRAAPALTWRHVWLPDGSLQLEASNHGSGHVQIKDFDVDAGEYLGEPLHASDVRYILPGSVMHWHLPAQTSAASRASRLTIHGHSDAGDFTVTSDRVVQ